MKINECMSRDVRMADPNETIQQAARTMAKLDIGSLPVSEDDRLVGMLTDRDIAVRCVAEGKGPDARIRDIMSSEVLYCFDDQDCDEVLRNMGEVQVRRLPVVDRAKRLVGIVSLGDLAAKTEARDAGAALSDISRHGGLHTQTH